MVDEVDLEREIEVLREFRDRLDKFRETLKEIVDRYSDLERRSNITRYVFGILRVCLDMLSDEYVATIQSIRMLEEDLEEKSEL